MTGNIRRTSMVWRQPDVSKMWVLDISYFCIASGGFIPTRLTRWGPVCMSSSSFKAYHKVHVGWSDLSTAPSGQHSCSIAWSCRLAWQKFSQVGTEDEFSLRAYQKAV